MRVFIALELPESVKEEVAMIQQQLQESKLFEGKMTPLNNQHLTLKFLGEIDEKTLDEVKQRLEQVTTKKFMATIDGIGAFDERFIRIIWLHLQGPETLQKAIDVELVDLYNMEKRFMSHITINRVKKVLDKPALLNRLKTLTIKPITFPVKSFHLLQSKLSAKGPEYQILETYPLS